MSFMSDYDNNYTLDDTIKRDLNNNERELNLSNIMSSEYFKDCIDQVIVDEVNIKSRSEFLNKTKNSIMAECICKIMDNAYITPMSEANKLAGRNLVLKFVEHAGANNLIIKFAKRNILLSEIARITQKYYKLIVESVDDNNMLIVDPTIDEEFQKELKDLDTEEVTKLIKDKVSDAMVNFADTNVAAKLDYMDIIDSAKDQIDNPNLSETMKESLIEHAERTVAEREATRDRSIYQYMIESMIKQAITDNNLIDKYVKGANVDMDAITESAQIPYTLLEMLNTTNMIDINEEFLNDYINNL